MKEKFNWKRLLITLIIVFFTAAATGGTTWYYMDQANETQKGQINLLEGQIAKLLEMSKKKVAEKSNKIQETAPLKDEINTKESKYIDNSNISFTRIPEGVQYSDKENKYSMTLPSDWGIEDRNTNWVIFKSSSDDKDLVSLTIESAEATIHGLEGVGDTCFEGDIIIAGVKADKTTYCGVSKDMYSEEEYNQNKDSKLITIDFQKDNRDYGILFHVQDKNHYNAEKDILEPILKSFKFI